MPGLNIFIVIKNSKSLLLRSAMHCTVTLLKSIKTSFLVFSGTKSNRKTTPEGLDT